MKTENTSRDILARGNRIEKIIIAITAVVLIIAFILVFLNRGRITAVTMRIIEFRGSVLLEEQGRVKTVRKNARLNSEDVVSTEAGSNVKIGLDEAKIVGLEENSRASISKKGRQLELVLESGTLDFEVSRPLEADETLNIKTTTMIVGIRGTAGTVSSIGDLESVEITDGVVHVTVTNPVTGETKEIDVHAGEKITVNSEDGIIIDNPEIISENPTTTDEEEIQQENNEETEDQAAEGHFELVEVSDELRNSILTDGCVQVGNAIIRRDRTMTIGEAVALLEQDGEVTTEKYKKNAVAVYRRISDHPDLWEKDNELLCWLVKPYTYKGESIMDAPLAQVMVARNSPHRLNVIYPGNICGLFVAGVGELIEQSVSFDYYYSEYIEERREEYSRFVNISEDEYVSLCEEMCSQAGLTYLPSDRPGGGCSSHFVYGEGRPEDNYVIGDDNKKTMDLNLAGFIYSHSGAKDSFSVTPLLDVQTEEGIAHIEETENILVVE